MEKKILIIGVGGRTGTMFAQELEKTGEVLGVGREKEIEEIKEKRVYLKIKGKDREIFRGKVIKDFEFSNVFLPDIIFLATKNPVGPPIKYYYQKIKGRLPALVLSQNGLVAVKEAKEALREVLGKKAEEVQIIRTCLFNAIDRKEIHNEIYISYSLPICLSFGAVSGSKETGEIRDIFDKAGFRVKEFPPANVKDMEFSKLLLNLIGIASATRGLSIEEGFKDKEIFKEEIRALREYIRIVRGLRRNFLNFPWAPVKLGVFLINFLPLKFLLLFRKKLGRFIAKERGKKPKSLDEIEYYNGAVVSLGKEIGLPTPINQKIIKRVL